MWWYDTFIAEDTDTWYVYFSKAYGSGADTGINVELDIVIRTETDRPVFDSVSTLPETVSASVAVSFSVSDDCFPIDRVELLVDGQVIATSENTEVSRSYEGALTWSTWFRDGVHNVTLIVYDTFGRASLPYDLGQVTVDNMNWYILGVIGIIVIIVICWRVSKK